MSENSKLALILSEEKPMGTHIEALEELDQGDLANIALNCASEKICREAIKRIANKSILANILSEIVRNSNRYRDTRLKTILWEIQETRCQDIAKYGDIAKDVESELFGLICTDESPEEEGIWWRSVYLITDQKFLEFLATRHTNPRIRGDAVDKLNNPDIRDIAIKDDDPRVRLSALTSTYNEELLVYAIRNDDNLTVRVEALIRLGELNPALAKELREELRQFTRQMNLKSEG